MALSLKNRISLKEYRGKFFESGKSFYSPLLQTIVLKESVDSSTPQFAVSISKKVAKKAHDRNLLRRQIQQLIQENLSAFPGYKYLFLPSKIAASSPHSDLASSFQVLIKRISQ